MGIVNTAATDEGTRPRTVNSRTKRLIPLLGPALVAGVAYLDPGNVASNMTAGAQFGYLLVWVVVLGQRHGLAGAVPLGETGHRDRPQPAGD